MKKHLIAVALASVSMTSLAAAADLPMRSPPPAPFVAPLPVFTWTGFYAGVNAGYAFNGDTTFNRTTGALPNNVNALAINARPGSHRVSDDGFTAGGQIGYNYQFGAGNGIVVGVEADAAYMDLDKSDNVNTLVGGVTRINRYHGSLDYLGTVRGRVGYAFNQFLVYGTGGFAYGDANTNAIFYNPGGTTPFFAGGKSGMKTGYAYGGGVEYALPTGSFLNFFHSSAVTVKAEYLHYDLGTDTIALNSVNGGPGAYTARVKTDGDLARIGLNYKF